MFRMDRLNGQGSIVCDDCRVVLVENPQITQELQVDNTYCPTCKEKLLNRCGYHLRDDCDMRSDEPDTWDGYTLAWSLYSDKPHFMRHAVYACHPDKHTKESARLWALDQAYKEALVEFKFLRNEVLPSLDKY